MARFRRDTARNLCPYAFKNDNLLMDAFRVEIEAGRLKPKAAEKAIILYYQNQARFTSDLEASLSIYGL
jgi:hypothetical protein